MEKVAGKPQAEGCKMRVINQFSRIFFAGIILLVVSANSLAGQFNVTRVTDGNTIKVSDNGSNITVRLVGIDAPETSKKKNESGQPYSKKSTRHLAGFVLNKSVTVKSYGTDRYGRTLGVVFVNGQNVNIEMVKVGLAEVYRGKPAKGLDMNPYVDAEAGAKKAGIGMWSLGDKYISPKEWRRMHRK
jgi:endonuclease YncB( thermonuclease family)